MDSSMVPIFQQSLLNLLSLNIMCAFSNFHSGSVMIHKLAAQRGCSEDFESQCALHRAETKAGRGSR